MSRMEEPSTPTRPKFARIVRVLVGASGTAGYFALAAWSYTAATVDDTIAAGVLLTLGFIVGVAALVLSEEYGAFADRSRTRLNLSFAGTLFIISLSLFGWEYHHRPTPIPTATEVAEQVARRLTPLMVNPGAPRTSVVNAIPRVVLLYQDGQLRLYNLGASEIRLSGNQLDDTGKDIVDRPRIIPGGGNCYYYFILDSLERWSLGKIGRNGDLLANFDIYLLGDHGKKYTARTALLLRMSDGKLTVHPQMFGVDEKGW
jgi:hypothetical protein